MISSMNVSVGGQFWRCTPRPTRARDPRYPPGSLIALFLRRVFIDLQRQEPLQICISFCKTASRFPDLHFTLQICIAFSRSWTAPTDLGLVCLIAISFRLVIQHQVHDDAGYGNVHPGRESPSRDSHVILKAAFKSEECRAQNQRQNGGGQDRMRNQQGEINAADPSRFSESNTSDVVVVNEVGSQKQG